AGDHRPALRRPPPPRACRTPACGDAEGWTVDAPAASTPRSPRRRRLARRRSTQLGALTAHGRPAPRRGAGRTRGDDDLRGDRRGRPPPRVGVAQVDDASRRARCELDGSESSIRSRAMRTRKRRVFMAVPPVAALAVVVVATAVAGTSRRDTPAKIT